MDTIKKDIFRQEYKPMTSGVSEYILKVKAKAQELYDLIEGAAVPTPDSMRYQALAKTKLEESIMHFTKGITS